MAGSDHSGEEVQSGRTNRAEDRTQIWAQRPEDPADDYNGKAIFIVEVAGDYPDWDEDNGSFLPAHPLDGIIGSGWSSNVTLGGVGGSGVVGNGGNNQGTGVLGKGGSGGIGVHGIGGSQTEPTWDPTTPPGAGAVAQGGRQTDNSNTLRLPHGAGIIAVAGGNGKPLPPFTDTGSVGVFGQGAEGETRTVKIDNTDTPVGPLSPGPGVLGRGGVAIPPESPSGAGVIGIAGGTDIPTITFTGNVGVYGECGPGNGVSGRGFTGVLGTGIGGRGGMFSSDRSAQVQLVPMVTKGTFPSPSAVTPMGITIPPDDRERQVAGLTLPKNGNGGDLMVLMDSKKECTLWFCVFGGDGMSPAKWAQVLLGPSIDGVL